MNLHNVWPEFSLLVSTLDLDDLQDPGGEGVVVEPPAGPQRSCDDDRLRNHVHGAQVKHALES